MTFEKGISTIILVAAFAVLVPPHAMAQKAAPASQSGTTAQEASATQQNIAPAGAAPFGPLTAQHQEYLDSILSYWEHSTSKIKRYRCEFKRWEYDSVFGPKNTYKTYSEGAVKYAEPDKGLFKVEKIFVYQAPPPTGGKVSYELSTDETTTEHWVCDGQSIFEHDHRKKQLVERRLPPDMRGKSITEGPLPFLFGAKAEAIKRRYWIRVITPDGTKGEYWLEAYPKLREDAADFLKVHVIIDEAKFMPRGLIVFDRNYDGQRNTSRTTFMLENREVNWSLLPEKLNLFHREFYRPALPSGWTKVVQDFRQPVAAQPTGSAPERR